MDKDKDIVELAEKQGNNADLFILDKVHEVDEKVEAVKAEIETAHEEIEQKFDNTVQELKDNTPNLDKVLESVRGTQGEKGDKPNNEELLALIEPLIPEPIPGDKGEKGESIIGPKGDKGESGESIVGPEGKPGINGSPDTPVQVREKLESLEGEERLDKSAIKGLDEEIKKAQETKQFSVFGGARNSVEFTDLSAQLNGSLKVFTVPRRRFIAVFTSFAPYILRPEVDFQGSGTYTLTITSEIPAGRLAAGQTLILLHSRI